MSDNNQDKVTSTESILDDTVLGKHADYPCVYTPSLLQSIPRQATRDGMFLYGDRLPFSGIDIWNAYELSWLNSRGKPEVAIAELRFPGNSTNLIESKSLKLYLNSFSETRFGSAYEVRQTMESDLSVNAKAPVEVKITALAQAKSLPIGNLPGDNLDELDAEIDCYEPDASLMSVVLGKQITETLNTNLFRSVCPVTGQPDWGSFLVSYTGQPIKHEGLLKYFVSYRRHAAFHEQCVEKIFMDILQAAAPEKLTVYGRFVRRGGLDINPMRTNNGGVSENVRLIRQ